MLLVGFSLLVTIAVAAGAAFYQHGSDAPWSDGRH